MSFRTSPASSSAAIRPRRAKRSFLTPLWVLAALVGATFFGFVLFERLIASFPKTVVKTDAVVIFTGETYRVSVALELLKAKAGKRLLITGVHPASRTDEFILRPHRAFLKCCVDLDYTAKNTEGNAIATAAWARQNDFRSLLLVTSRYHLPRAMTELKREAPNLNVIPYPADPEGRETRDPAPSIFNEYLKFLGAQVRARMERFLRRLKEART